VQIDHVVALAAAWRIGARMWNPARRLRYANDPSVLLAVDGPENEAKGDDDASEWLPENSRFACAYIATQVSIKAKYDLWVTPPEHDAMVGLGPAPPVTLPRAKPVGVYAANRATEASLTAARSQIASPNLSR
jgi:Protein of unknown function (DUF1524)